MLRLKRVGLFALLCSIAGGATASPGESEPACHVGIYQLTDGRRVDIAPEGAALRWRMIDGSVGKLSRQPDGNWESTEGWTETRDGKHVTFGSCSDASIRFAGVGGRAMSFVVRDISFESGGATLRGRLVLPSGTGRVPIMVLGHGSEKTSALVNGFRQRLYPAYGIGVFVFDKRGTGGSGGKYTQDFEVLASDMAAALQQTRQLAGARAGRIGFEGGSQAGWVLPLAATKTDVDFVIVGYGIAASPLVEDRTQTMQDLAAAGWGADVLAKAREVTDATAAIRLAHFASGYEKFNDAVARYRNEPWFKNLKGEYTGEMIKYTEAQLRVGGPQRDEGTLWDFDAVGVLGRLKTPLLWMVAGKDSEGPGEETPVNLLALKALGHPISVALFPNAEHGIHELRILPDGRRELVAYGRSYFAMEMDFARNGRLKRSYPGAKLLQPPRRTRVQR
jgi:pimeloyl-ACP methyl ester carboxylesterase